MFDPFRPEPESASLHAFTGGEANPTIGACVAVRDLSNGKTKFL